MGKLPRTTSHISLTAGDCADQDGQSNGSWYERVLKKKKKKKKKKSMKKNVQNVSVGKEVSFVCQSKYEMRK